MGKPKRVIRYKDPLNDDFAGTHIASKPLPKKFKWTHRSPFWNLFSHILYFALAMPILYLVGKIAFGVKVAGRRKLRKAHIKGSYFLYCNHTSIGDAWAMQAYIAKGRYTKIVSSQDSVNIRGFRWLVMLLGVSPVPTDQDEHKKFAESLAYDIKKKRPIAVYPEAHIWPYYTSIRPFGEASFSTPAKNGLPIVPVAATYEKRTILRFLPPRIVYHVSDPIYPDMSKGLVERTKELRDRTYGFMMDTVSSFENYEHIRYIKEPN